MALNRISRSLLRISNAGTIVRCLGTESRLTFSSQLVTNDGEQIVDSTHPEEIVRSLYYEDHVFPGIESARAKDFADTTENVIHVKFDA